MKANKSVLLASVMLAASSLLVQGVELVRDNYTASNVGSGFALGNGVNSGINPPTTRLTGSSAANLRYICTTTNKAQNSYTIGSNKLKVANASGSGRFTFSANGTTPFDFASALGVVAASPANPSIYEIRINMDNDSAGTQRFSLGFGSAETDANNWDFGIQLYRAASTDTNYAVQKRIDSLSNPTAADVNLPIATGFGTFGTEMSFMIRVTDAGPESGTNYSSRLQVYQLITSPASTNLIYDTQTDADIQNQWRLDGGGRFISWDIAGSAVATYDTFVLELVSAPTVSSSTWTGAGADDFWSSGDNWGGVAPVSGQAITFAGTTRQANINDIVDLSVSSVTFNNGGFSLSGIPWAITTGVTNVSGINTFASDVFWTNTFLKSWSIATGSKLVLNNTNSIEVNGDNTLLGGGTMHVKGPLTIGLLTTANPAFSIAEGTQLIDGTTFSSRGGYRIGTSATGAGAQTVLTNGASFTLTASGANMRVGDSVNPVASRLDIDNSTLTMTGGNLGLPYTAGATGVVNQVGGLVAGGIIAFSDNGAGSGTYNIKNGVLDTLQIRKDTPAGFGAISFDNAILRTSVGANSAFFTGIDSAVIQSGGLAIDATSEVTIAQPLSGTGNLIKSNSATVTLTGANTYTGNTIVDSGKLVLSTIQSNATTVQVSNGAELGVVVTTPGTSLTVPALQFNGASGTLTFDFATFSSPTAPLIRANSLSVAGPVTINVLNGLQLVNGQIALIDYTGSISGGFQFNLSALPAGVTATLVNNTANSSVDLLITGVPGYRWTGATDNNWDTSTINWVDQQTGNPSAYADGFPTLFNDAAATGLVNIGSFPSPAIITVSNTTLPYVWNNTGGALTVPTIRKFGTNSLTRISGEADFVTTIELEQGSFVSSNAGPTSFTTTLTDTGVGTGTFVKDGASVITMSATNSNYDGKILVKAGTLKLANTGSLGTTNGTTTIASGATLDINDITAQHEPVFVSGQGVDGLGAIIDTTTGGGVANSLTDVTLLGDTTFGVPNGGRWDIRVRPSSGPGPGLKGNGFNLRKVGSGTVSIAAQRSLNALTPYWEMNLGDVVIEAGSLAFAESLTLGNPSKTITVLPDASVQLYDLGLTNPILRNIILNNARLNCGGGNTDTNVVNGSISLTGANSCRPDQAVLIVNGPITGSGSFAISAVEPGRVYLNGVNTYTGDTIVTNGTLGGTGVIAGNLIMLGGTNAPGMGVGMLTVNGSVTLAGTTTMELNRTLSPNSDRLVVGGTFTAGGLLKVVTNALPQAGDVYQLFNKGFSGSFTTISLPDISTLPGGLSWDTSNLAVNGTISVNGTATPPVISSVSSSGGNIIFSGTGGIQGNSYFILSSTNITTPVANWIPVETNVFGAGGSFAFTNAINPLTPTMFYLLKTP